jgi:hypothetical protein
MNQSPANPVNPPFSGDRFAAVGFENLEVGKYYYIVLRDIDLVDNYVIGKVTQESRRRDGSTSYFQYEIHSDYIETPQPHWEPQNPPVRGHAVVFSNTIIRPDEQAVGMIFYRDTTLGGKRRRKTRRGGKRYRRKTSKK